MKLKRKLPRDRTFDQLKNHYEVERALAQKLLAASREERKSIYAGMYDELFSKVPDHPRRSRTLDRKRIVAHNSKKSGLVDRFVHHDTVFVEFAPGDCTFAYHMCSRAGRVYAIDICDQRSGGGDAPPNFSLEIYNGYDLPLERGIADIVFSDQFIEHLHPEDTDFHLSLARSVLKKGGRYILRTPHAFFGPWDISAFFSDTPEGFHLKEWTFTELNRALKRSGFSKTCGMKRFSRKYKSVPVGCFILAELLLKNLPPPFRRKISRLFIPMQLIIVAEK